LNRYRGYFHGYPGWRTYGAYYGLAPALVGVGTLGFLSDGLLLGSYDYGAQTVYVYIVEEDGVPVEYTVDSYGNVLSVRVLG
jgi:hypothetical protein